MARLNEPPVSTDSIETLRRKMLRQNRDLAKSNNVRALRIRELENDCACMLSENLELRARILELEKQAEDNDARRIADHALAIKSKLESQLTEWGTLLAGLGLEPPMKRHSPHIKRRVSRQRMSFISNRPSPSQRRLRDIARDIEELGPISEHKPTSRKSMNPEQILALRSEAEMAESPELGPPPMSQYIDNEPLKVDSPSRAPPVDTPQPSPKRAIEPPVTLTSPKSENQTENPPSPEKKKEPVNQKQATETHKAGASDSDATPPVKIGSKRKLAVRDEAENARLHRVTDENKPPRAMAEKTSIREKAGGKTLKELASMRKEARDKPTAPSNPPRKALAAKSTNNDVNSPKKPKPATTDEVAAAKADLVRSKSAALKKAAEKKATQSKGAETKGAETKGAETKATETKGAEPKTTESKTTGPKAEPEAAPERPKPKPKHTPTVKVEAIASPARVAPSVATCELGRPLTETALLSPNSPEPVSSSDGPRGDTPPPADISSNGETTRPSRRNKTAVSYAEPNLRDKMRRPSKQLFDAVAGEGKYARRSSQCEPLTADGIKIKRESIAGDSWKRVSTADVSPDNGPDAVPASPLAGKSSVPEELPSSVATERRRRPSAAARLAEVTSDSSKENPEEASNEEETSLDTSGDGDGDVDVYEFTPSSPRTDNQEGGKGRRRSNARQSKSSRRFSTAVDSEAGLDGKERTSSRRRSMML